MGKWISGEFYCHIRYNNVYIEEGQDELDVLFPGGWEGEMVYDDLGITEEKSEECEEAED